MNRRTCIFLITGASCIAAAPLLSRHGYLSSRNQFIADRGEFWVHEHLYFGSRWDVFALCSLFVGVILFAAGVITWYRRHTRTTHAGPA